MPPVLTSLQILARIKIRVETRLSALEGVKLDGYTVAILELKTVLSTVNKAMGYVRDRERQRKVT